jgi:NADPH2:quinone reductase
MKAVIITHPGGPEVLQVQDRPLPEPVAGQVRVRVHVAGLNRADIMQREGKYPPPADAPADIPGLEIMGTIDAVGPNVTTWQIGQRVFGLVGGGGYAEYVVTHERLLAPVPDNLSDTQAGATPEAFMTAHDALFTQAGLQIGERVLIHAIGSGVATAAMQLAHAVGCTTFGTARSADKIERAKEMGLDHALPLPDFAPALLEATDNKGVNVIIDFVGAPYFEANLQSLATLGRLVQVGTLAGASTQLNLGLLMQKRLRLMGTVLRSRPLEEKAQVTQRFAQQVVPLLASGAVKPVVDKVFELGEVVEAHRYMESNANFGKILLQL